MKIINEVEELGGMTQDVPHIYPEHLPVFEGVERRTPGGVVRGRLGPVVDRKQSVLQFRLQLLPGLAGLQGVQVPHDGKQVRILHPQKIIPEKIADPKQPRQRVEHLVPFERGEIVRPIGPSK